MPVAGGPYYWIWWMPRWLVRWLRWGVLAPPIPGPLTVEKQEEARVLRYTINMPPRPPIGDLATREVTIQLNGVPEVRPLPPDAPSFQFDTDVDVAVNITMVDIDTSGNRSG